MHRELANRACAALSQCSKVVCTPVAVGDSPGWSIVRKATDWSADWSWWVRKAIRVWNVCASAAWSHKGRSRGAVFCADWTVSPATDELRIIVAVDGSIDSKAALHTIAFRTWRPGTKFRIVVVVEPHIETAMSWPGFCRRIFVQANDASGP
jgi:hypothetical protein